MFGMSGVLSLTPGEMSSKASSPRCDHVLISWAKNCSADKDKHDLCFVVNNN